MKKLINISFVFAVVSTCLVLFYGCSVPESPLVITKKVRYLDPILGYDFTPAVYDIPPRYSRKGVHNPFLEVERDKYKMVKVAKVEKVKVVVPSTPLTKWVITQFNLTGVLITSKSTSAFFVGPDSGKAYTGRTGDYIGRAGIKIDNITTGAVHLSNGRRLVVNQ